MDEHPSLLIGHESGDHLRLTARGRVFPQRTDFWDANWIHGSMELRAGAFRAKIGSYLRTTEFAAFRGELQRLYAELHGEAALESMETWISLRLKGNGHGHISVDGDITDAPGMGNRLTFSLPGLDQTELPALIRSLLHIEATYPTLRDPSR